MCYYILNKIVFLCNAFADKLKTIIFILPVGQDFPPVMLSRYPFSFIVPLFFAGETMDKADVILKNDRSEIISKIIKYCVNPFKSILDRPALTRNVWVRSILKYKKSWCSS